MREALLSNHGTTDFYRERLEQKTVNNRFISGLLDSADKCFSIELCPGRKLNTELLPKLGLNFCSVTWHRPTEAELKRVEAVPAIELARRLSCQGYNVLLHLAGRNLRRELALEILNVVKGIGVRNIFALQGDLSQIVEEDDTKCDFPYAIDLVRFIRLHFGNYFCIGVAGYPDKHPSSTNLEEDVAFLKKKVSSGANFVITQASYDYDSFTNFLKLCRESEINVPIIPGIFIISSYKTLIGMSKFCAVPISPDVLSIVSKNKHNTKAVKEFGIYHATRLIKLVVTDKEHLFGGIHIFSLNDLNLVKEVLKRLGVIQPRLEYPL